MSQNRSCSVNRRTACTSPQPGYGDPKDGSLVPHPVPGYSAAEFVYVPFLFFWLLTYKLPGKVTCVRALAKDNKELRPLGKAIRSPLCLYYFDVRNMQGFTILANKKKWSPIRPGVCGVKTPWRTARSCTVNPPVPSHSCKHIIKPATQ